MGLRIKKSTLFTMLTNICRVVLALVLVASGFVKAVDPKGTMYKMQEYLSAFTIDNIFSEEWLLLFASILAAVEFLLGLFMLMGVYRKFVSTFVFILFLFFTLFTSYIAVYDPVSDCGCFGDVWVLSNEQTLLKNLFLLLLATIVFCGRRRFIRNVSYRNRWAVVLYSIFYIVFVEGLSLVHVPVIDFRQYKVGNDLRVLTQSSPDKYKIVSLYERGEEFCYFDEDTVPGNDWVFVEATSVLDVKGEPAVIDDFSILDWKNDYDVAEDVLSDTGYVCVIVSEAVENASVNRIDRVNDLYDYCLENGIQFYMATASDEENMELWQKRTGAEYDLHWADKSMLRDMTRANPGLVLIKDGIIKGKWTASDIPEPELVFAPISKSGFLAFLDNALQRWYSWLLLLAIPLLVLSYFDFLVARIKDYRKAADDNEIKENSSDI